LSGQARIATTLRPSPSVGRSEIAREGAVERHAVKIGCEGALDAAYGKMGLPATRRVAERPWLMIDVYRTRIERNRTAVRRRGIRSITTKKLVTLPPRAKATPSGSLMPWVPKLIASVLSSVAAL
jgi:hypothetical protein